jgi:anthranilate synthase/aminodeoxychorismate synthase-like glutamine amidotransferase
MTPRLLLIDNYDSFTYNLVQAFLVLDARVLVYRNDALALAAARDLRPTHLVISPGPGRPADAGMSLEFIRAFAADIPILGVCLGHQCLVEAFGGRIIGARRLMHGKTSDVQHDNGGVFKGLANPMEVGRYHSLAADGDQIPDELLVTARTSDGEIMGVRHRSLPLEGVQFHPESVLTPNGDQLLANFLYPDQTAES